MSIIKKIGKVGNNCLGISIPTEVFQLLDINPGVSRYYYRADEEGRIYVSVLSSYQKKIDERKFVKRGTAWWAILPLTLIDMWNLELKAQIEIKLNRDNLMELELIPLNLK